MKHNNLLSCTYSNIIKGRPDEDYFVHNHQKGLYAVADGVSLWKNIEYTGLYPRKSPAFDISKRFCDQAISYAQKNQSKDIIEIFAHGNKSVQTINKDRSKFTAFKKHNGLYAATSAFARISGNKLEWAHICDSGVAVIDKNGKIKLKKDSCRNYFEWPTNAQTYDADSGTFFGHTLLANAIGKNKKKIGYGVITGEPKAMEYVEHGTYKLSAGDTVVVYTDGFEPFFQLPDFIKLMSEIDIRENAKKDLDTLIDKLNADAQHVLRKHKVNMRLGYVEVIEQMTKIFGPLNKNKINLEYIKEKTLIAIKVL